MDYKFFDVFGGVFFRMKNFEFIGDNIGSTYINSNHVSSVTTNIEENFIIIYTDGSKYMYFFRSVEDMEQAVDEIINLCSKNK